MLIRIGIRELRNNIDSPPGFHGWIKRKIFLARPGEGLAPVNYFDHQIVVVLHKEMHFDISIVIIVVSVEDNIGAGLGNDQLQIKEDLPISSEHLQEGDSPAGDLAAFVNAGFGPEGLFLRADLLRLLLGMGVLISRGDF